MTETGPVGISQPLDIPPMRVRGDLPSHLAWGTSGLVTYGFC